MLLKATTSSCARFSIYPENLLNNTWSTLRENAEEKLTFFAAKKNYFIKTFSFQTIQNSLKNLLCRKFWIEWIILFLVSFRDNNIGNIFIWREQFINYPHWGSQLTMKFIFLFYFLCFLRLLIALLFWYDCVVEGGKINKEKKVESAFWKFCWSFLFFGCLENIIIVKLMCINLQLKTSFEIYWDVYMENIFPTEMLEEWGFGLHRYKSFFAQL